MTRYQQGFNPYTGPVHLPKTEAVETAKNQLVANTDQVTAAKPFPRMFDMWSTAIKLAVMEELDPSVHVDEDRRRFHDNVGSLIGGDVPMMALLATIAVRYEYMYDGKVFEEAIQILDDAPAQVRIADLYAHAGMVRLLEVVRSHGTAPGPALTRHFQTVLREQELAGASST